MPLSYDLTPFQISRAEIVKFFRWYFGRNDDTQDILKLTDLYLNFATENAAKQPVIWWSYLPKIPGGAAPLCMTFE